jgi:hypothetical protein
MFFTGIPCKNGHIEPRYVNTGICYGCKRQQARRDYASHTERALEANKRSRLKNPEAARAASREWSRQNPEKSSANKAAYKKRNIEKVREAAREYERERRKDPLYRLFSSASKSIWDFLKGTKAGRPFLSLVDWTPDELRQHLEQQFTPEMTWENYGSYWQVDHIIPQSYVTMFPTITEPEDLFQLFWGLDNLRPLPRRENLARGNRATPDELLAVALAHLERKRNRVLARIIP